MSKPDPRVDAYIRKAAPFAQPILLHIRAIVHEACPDAVETMKWSRPFFDFNGPLCGMAAFKAHCSLHFWKGGNIVSADQRKEGAMGQFGRITSVKDLPARRTLIAIVKKAAALNADGVRADWMERRVAARASRVATPVVVPADLAAALKKNRKAQATFDAFSPSHRREYVEWIEGAKRQDTRDRRLATAVAQMADGKSQNWKYEQR
jgi:uncharacterized protein YdeI (YjbR/CyaY-like superfamily)